MTGLSLKKGVALALALLVGVALLVYWGQLRNRNQELYYSGTIEVTQADLAFQTAGRAARVMVDEGHSVKAGQVLACLDASEALARLEQARAAFERAGDQRDQLTTALGIQQRVLPAELKRAQAGLARAHNVKRDASRNDARLAALERRGVVASKEREAMGLSYHNSRAAEAEAEAAVEAARANLGRIAATRQELAAARAAVRQAAAAVSQAEIQLAYYELKAPFAGTVTSRSLEPGEIVTAGQTVLSLSDLRRVELKIYVDETSIGRVRPGQAVSVAVDSLPGRRLSGRVSYISPEAEFTPKLIQTRKERVKLVYLVKIAIANPQARLKAGMPADAYLH